MEKSYSALFLLIYNREKIRWSAIATKGVYDQRIIHFLEIIVPDFFLEYTLVACHGGRSADNLCFIDQGLDALLDLSDQ